MKKYLLLILCFRLIPALAQTSVYHSFPSADASWNFSKTWYCWTDPSPMINVSYSCTFAGDTVIAAQTYHKIHIPFLQSVISSCSSGTSSFSVYKGAIREDSTLKKVFFVPPYLGSEQLLYDFNLNVGDTVRGYLETYASPVDIVQSIDSVLVGSNYRKRWHINNYYNISIIEGIGSTYGLVEPSPGAMTDAQECSLSCFKQDGQALYPSGSPCELITSVMDPQKYTSSISVFPNPFNDELTINLSAGIDIVEIEITDLTGNVVLKDAVNEMTDYKVKGLSSGTYFLILTDKMNRKFYGKIICTKVF
jgi:hypothetical protein